MFGYGWDFNFNIRLRKLSNGDITILTGENRRNEFKKVGASYQSPPGIYDTLTQEPDGSFKLTKKHGDLYQFDQDGKLMSRSDRNGNTLTFTYDPQGKLPVIGTSPYFVGQTQGIIVLDWRLIQMRDPVGRTIDLVYDTHGRLTKIKDFTGRVLIYQYDANGDLISFGEVPPEGLLPGETLMGYHTTYTYTNHNLETITDAKGKVYLKNVYNPEDRVTEQTYGDPQESGGKSIISYEILANQTTVTDRKGFTTLWTFDPNGNPIRKEAFTKGVRPSDPASYVTLYEYNANLEQTKIIDPKGHVTEMRYDAKGNLLEVRSKGTAPNPDIVTTFTYESQFNQVKTIQDPRGNVTTYTYDLDLGEPAKGNLRKITFPSVDGQTIASSFTSNSFGQMETATDPNGNVTKDEYVPATGYLKKMTNGFGTPDASVIQMTYDAVGNVQTVVDPRTNTTSVTYDVNNNLTQVTSPAPFNFLTKYTYDANGNLEKVERQSDASGSTFQATNYTYTALDQLKTMTDTQGNVTTFQYDANGNRTKIIDAELKATTYLYDERELLFQVTDAKSGVTTYGYDPNGNLTSLKDANTNTTTYTYDEFDRLTRLTYPGGSQETYAYDVASNLTSRLTPATQTLTYAYDALNRLTQKVLPGETATYTYDVGSRLLTATDADVALTSTYDALNRATQVVTDPVGPLAATTVRYAYDPAGNRTQLTPPSGSALTYVYDALNRLTTLREGAATPATFTYDALSRRTQLQLANGTSPTYQYDAGNRLTSLLSATVGNRSYTYDALGNRLTLTDPAGAHAYTYDPLSQVTAVDYPAGVAVADTTFTLDPLGNRTQTVDGGTTSYTTNVLNQYTAVGGTAFTYDPTGNLTSDGVRTYTYDSENRLLTATGPGLTASYTSDPFGRRLSKTVNGLTTRFLYDGDQIVAETDASGVLTASYVYGTGIDEPLRQQRGGVTSYYHADGLGSIVALTDPTGTVVERVTYDVYGTPRITDAAGTVLSQSALGNRFLFTGREYDAETGLYHYRWRYYDSRLGRFISRDPLGYLPDVNLYRYVGNNPLRWIDPWGFDKTKPWWEQLEEGYYYGTGFGQEAAEWYAQQQTITGNWLWAIPGSIASRWTPQTYQATGWTLVGAAAYTVGFEISIGRNFRFAPFGNRTGHPTGEWPHYHRRVPDPRHPGQSLPGQGGKRHRPWDPRSADTSFWDRF